MQGSTNDSLAAKRKINLRERPYISAKSIKAAPAFQSLKRSAIFDFTDIAGS